VGPHRREAPRFAGPTNGCLPPTFLTPTFLDGAITPDDDARQRASDIRDGKGNPAPGASSLPPIRAPSVSAGSTFGHNPAPLAIALADKPTSGTRRAFSENVRGRQAPDLAVQDRSRRNRTMRMRPSNLQRESSSSMIAMTVSAEPPPVPAPIRGNARE